MGEDIRQSAKPDAASRVSVFQKRKQLERDLEHITQEMYKRNRELIETNKTLSLIRSIDSLVLESPYPLPVVSQQVVKTISESTEYAFVSLFIRSYASENLLEMRGFSSKDGKADTFFEQLPGICQLDITQDWYTHAERNQLFAFEKLSSKRLTELTGWPEAISRKALKVLPVKSVYIVKLYARQRLVGMLVAGFYNATTNVNASEILMLDRISEGIGIVLDNKLLTQENQRVLQQLQRSNEKLKALDETKDDFISMASHQLRTPLTAVKGYLSMVIEGDAGEINPMQQKMLNQAYISSQRMVFLIADLLNVSRLKTGKFIIERSPVNLSDMIDEELDQLQETAAARQLDIHFAKPEAFPTLMLDETKTRQVVMNFIDNAIHYTPQGGHIKVELHDKPQSIELEVRDDGIGVPQPEQRHLFTKFYRAGNARRERPDGTGLGLFMAKKVVVAQGGAVLFESKENKGSTFGFTIPKSRLQSVVNKS